VAWSALLAAGFAIAFSAHPNAAADAAPRANTCQNPAQALGVSRVVEVDTANGPRFGHQQYKDINLLAPGEVVLTFDDGPLRPHTQPIVDALEAQCTKATFFMVGSQAIADPEMVKQIIRKGHTVGTHTWSHANLRKATPLKARQEIELGFSAVTAAAGQPIAPFFRFPFLADTKAMLGYTQTRGMGDFSIEVDSLDYRTKSAAAVHRDVLNQLADMGKGIILFHDIQPATAQALPGLLEALRAKGYRVVHLKPKTMATTLPEFDALAKDSHARKQMAAAQPLANRSVTWAAASPSVAARMPAPNGALGATGPYGTAQPNRSAAGVPAPLPGQAAIATAVPPPPPPGVAGLPAPGYGAGYGVSEPLPPPKVARQRGPVDEDWRDSIFRR
jgi:peptidoglycan/xylan/chitin deacetylase (PgdA/CDA1 family)